MVEAQKARAGTLLRPRRVQEEEARWRITDGKRCPPTVPSRSFVSNLEGSRAYEV